ncbi:uncharacterized protein IWZ02DRAFT_152991 [Phyllosticta citriasiana]|uniref:uncharacterized protein n=1 Tax=Phyllosticta citriasiana TaxID=595635 RepID=UPI0030FD70C2
MFSLLIFSVLTLFSVSAQARTVWTRGMGLWVYAQLVPDEGHPFGCPPTKPDADSLATLCRVFVQNGKVLCSRNPGEAGRRILIANGFSEGIGALTVPTLVQVAELNSAHISGCWSLGPDDNVRVMFCGPRKFVSQKIFISPTGQSDGAYHFHSDHLSKPLMVGPGGALIASNEGAAVFCLYETTYGNPVNPPSHGAPPPH